MREPVQKALALSRKGYSHHGIAKELDVTSQTAKKYLKEIEQEMGREALTDF